MCMRVCAWARVCMCVCLCVCACASIHVGVCVYACCMCLSVQDVDAGIPLLPCGDNLVLISFRQLFIHSPHCNINFTLVFPSRGGWGVEGTGHHLHAPNKGFVT